MRVCVCGRVGGGQLHGVKFMIWPVLSTAQRDTDSVSTFTSPFTVSATWKREAGLKSYRWIFLI